MILFHSLSLQDSNSPMMLFISMFHDHAMFIIIMIFSVVVYIFGVVILFPCFSRFFSSNEVLEGLWTVTPCFVLISLAIPSLSTLYLSEESSNPLLSIKVTGHQWYWSYEINDFVEFDSYLVPSASMKTGDYRLLETDTKLVLPIKTDIRMIITSSDVIHSWTVPSLGTKVDAVPGRLNQLLINADRIGILYGQCSEICGSLHSFMPIVVEFIPSAKMVKFLGK